MTWAAPISFKTRVTLLTLLIFGLGLLAVVTYASQVLRSDIEEVVSAQQISTVSVLAAHAQTDVQMRLQALEALGAELGSQGLQDAQAVQTRLDQDRLSALLFNRGSFVTGPDGVALASSPSALGRVGINYSDRDYIAVALASGRASVGRPVIGRPLGKPVLVMAAPVRDAQGRVLGVVAGAIDLALPNFLDQITGNGYGETGGFFVVSREHRLVVTASDPARVMQALPPVGVNPVIDRLMQGYEGSVRLVNQHGTEVLNSGKSVPAAGWDVVASLPVAEAFAPARHVQRHLLLAAGVLGVVLGGLLWWLLQRQLAPAVLAAQALATQAADSQMPAALPVERADEIGTLIQGFNGLLVKLARREADLRISDLALKSISEAVIFTLPDETVLLANPAHELITGYTEQELKGRNLRLLQGPQTDPATVAELRDAIKAQRIFQGDILNYRKDGTAFWNELTVSPVHDARGSVTHFVGITRDITERRRAQEQISRLAFYDALTQLPNRRLLNDRLEQALSACRRSGLRGALMFVDLDGFKPLNDRHGHGMGDVLLVQAAHRLRGCVREADTVARFGGDEFVVVLASLSAELEDSSQQAALIAEKVRHTLSEPYTLPGSDRAPAEPGRGVAGTGTHTVTHRCSASIGVALFSGSHTDIDELLRLADGAMYAAKQAGRDAVRFHRQAV